MKIGGAASASVQYRALSSNEVDALDRWTAAERRDGRRRLIRSMGDANFILEAIRCGGNYYLYNNV